MIWESFSVDIERWKERKRSLLNALAQHLGEDAPRDAPQFIAKLTELVEHTYSKKALRGAKSQLKAAIRNTPWYAEAWCSHWGAEYQRALGEITVTTDPYRRCDASERA